MSADIRKVILLVTRTLKMFHVKSSGWQLDAVRNGILLDVRKIFLSRHNRVYNIETCQPGSQHRTASSIFLPPHSRLSTSTVSKNRAIFKKKINNFPHPLLEGTERRRKEEEEVKIRDRYIYINLLSQYRFSKTIGSRYFGHARSMTSSIVVVHGERKRAHWWTLIPGIVITTYTRRTHACTSIRKWRSRLDAEAGGRYFNERVNRPQFLGFFDSTSLVAGTNLIEPGSFSFLKNPDSMIEKWSSHFRLDQVRL